MSWPKKKIGSSTPPDPAPDANDSAKVPEGAKEKIDKPVNYKRGKYNKSGKIATRKAFANTMNLNKAPSTKLP